jgi:hypothetical protein
MGRTSQSLETSAQADRQIGNEQAPLNTQLNNENNQYSAANADLSNLNSQASTLANADLSSQAAQEGYLQNIYNSLYSQEQNSAAAAEQKRMDDANIAAQQASQAAAARAATSTPTLVGGGSNTATATSRGNMTRNAVGGYGFTSANGQPVTMAQYLSQNGYGTASQIAQAAAQLLAASGSANDRNIANVISSGKYTPQQLAQRYPQVFGGSF